MAILKIVKNPCDTDEALYNLCKYIAKEGRTCGYCGGRGLYPHPPHMKRYAGRRSYGEKINGAGHITS